MPETTDNAVLDQPTATTNGASPLPTRTLPRLCVSDTPFRSTGVARVKVTQGGRESLVSLPIKSVDLSDVQDLVAHLQPSVPTKREFDKQTKRWVTVELPFDPEFLQRQTAYTRALARAWVFMAVDLDVLDAEGRVVWSADNSVRHLADTEAAYKAMGLTDSQLTDILAAVRQLTTLAEEELDRD